MSNVQAQDGALDEEIVRYIQDGGDRRLCLGGRIGRRDLDRYVAGEIDSGYGLLESKAEVVEAADVRAVVLDFERPVPFGMLADECSQRALRLVNALERRIPPDRILIRS